MTLYDKRMKISSGLLMYKWIDDSIEYFLVHPGGPFFRKKDDGYWTIPKGEPMEGEELLQTAVREFAEETGIVPFPPYLELGMVKQKGGKLVHGWAFEGEIPDNFKLMSNTFSLEWPPRSGKQQEFPEIDKARFFSDSEVAIKINEAQYEFVSRLKERLNNYE